MAEPRSQLPEEEQEEKGSNDTLEAVPVEEPQVAPTIELSTLETLQKELKECKDKYLRTLAEAENARKRLQKEKHELIQYAVQNILVDFLNPIDQMENALKYANNMSEEIKHWAVGFNMILTHFKDVLTQNGVTAFESEGKPFDPYKHEAIDTVDTDECAPGIVVEESVKGYVMGDKIIRPARVKVSKAKAPTMAQEQASEGNDNN